MSSTVPTRAIATDAVTSCARDSVRLMTAISLAPRRASAATIALAVPPAPTTTTRDPATPTPLCSIALQQPSPSVLDPINRPPLTTIVFTDCAALADSSTSPKPLDVLFSISNTASLCGMVTESAFMLLSPSVCNTPASASSRTSIATYLHSRFRSRNTALCIAGDKLCATGKPIIAATSSVMAITLPREMSQYLLRVVRALRRMRDCRLCLTRRKTNSDKVLRHLYRSGRSAMDLAQGEVQRQ